MKLTIKFAREVNKVIKIRNQAARYARRVEVWKLRNKLAALRVSIRQEIEAQLAELDTDELWHFRHAAQYSRSAS